MPRAFVSAVAPALVSGLAVLTVRLPVAVPPPPLHPQQQYQQPVVAAIARSLPSVLTVSSFGSVRDPLDAGSRVRTDRGTGSAFVVARRGSTSVAVTNFHVVSDSERVRVSIGDGPSVDAAVTLVDAAHDVAVLEFRAFSFDGAPPLRLCDLAPVVGEPVVAIGSPFGLGGTATSGIVSAVGREVAPGLESVQTDAAINPGNSGGPLIRVDGALDDDGGSCVLGMNTATAGPGVGFAVPSRFLSAAISLIGFDLEKPASAGPR